MRQFSKDSNMNLQLTQVRKDVTRRWNVSGKLSLTFHLYHNQQKLDSKWLNGIALYRKPSSTASKYHLPYGITQRSPATQHNMCPTITPAR